MKPLIGKYKLSKLDGMTYERVFINKLLKKYSNSTVKMYHSIFKIAVNAAVINKTIKENNFAHITVLGDGKKTNNFLSQGDLNKLLIAAKNNESITLYNLISFVANTGVRKGEAHGLKWRDIDFDNQTIKIERTRDSVGTRSPKTLNSYRTIYVDNTTLRSLKEYHVWCKQLKFSCGEHLNNDDFVFLSQRGAKPVSHSYINEGLALLIKEADIKKITPYGLRHTHATILLNRKVSVATVTKRLGYTANEINRNYGQSDGDADLQTVECFSAIHM